MYILPFRFLVILLISLISIGCLGCSLPRQIVENINGNYMDGLYSAKAQSLSQVCLYNIDECYAKVLDILNSNVIDAKVLKKNKYGYYILALVSADKSMEEIDSVFDANSADVGIYLSKVGPETTKVEIRSLSIVFVNYSAKKIFPELQKQN